VALAAMPWFALRIVHRFAREDFFPAPNVDTVLLHVVPRTSPMLTQEERPAWHTFVEHALCRSRQDARGTFRKLLSNLQWRLLAHDLAISETASLRELSPAQWIGVYRFARGHAPRFKQRAAGLLP